MARSATRAFDAVRAALRARRLVAAIVLVVCLSAVLAACTSSPHHPDLPNGPYSSKPNIVYVLTDDLDSGLVNFMPHVQALEHSGMTFTNYTVTDSLCCPSRASILTGKFPHDTHVTTNDPPSGGFGEFYTRGEESRTFATALQAGGYNTALMGKYLNGYPVGSNVYNYPTDHVPPGWTTWDGVSNGYAEFNYNMNRNHNLVHYGNKPADYLTFVLSALGRSFIRTSAIARKPFFLELATFAPHIPYTPAVRDRGIFQDLAAPEGPAFNRIPTGAPAWLENRPPLGAPRIAELNAAYVKRVEAVQSVDRMLGELELTLQQTGQLRNTIFVFNSDNGYHLGQHGLGAGKLTAFDTDIRVPLVIAGPGIAPNSVSADMAENIDLAPTFEQLAGVSTPPSVDGHSLVPILHGQRPPWRSVALVEHTGPDLTPTDPDAQSFISGNPPTYNAIRTKTFTYVRYETGAREYYDLVRDPAENHNVVASLSPTRIGQLDKIMNRLHNCHGVQQCWAAGRPGTAASS